MHCVAATYLVPCWLLACLGTGFSTSAFSAWMYSMLYLRCLDVFATFSGWMCLWLLVWCSLSAFMYAVPSVSGCMLYPPCLNIYCVFLCLDVCCTFSVWMYAVSSVPECVLCLFVPGCMLYLQCPDECCSPVPECLLHLQCPNVCCSTSTWVYIFWTSSS